MAGKPEALQDDQSTELDGREAREGMEMEMQMEM